MVRVGVNEYPTRTFDAVWLPPFRHGLRNLPPPARRPTTVTTKCTATYIQLNSSLQASLVLTRPLFAVSVTIY